MTGVAHELVLAVASSVLTLLVYVIAVRVFARRIAQRMLERERKAFAAIDRKTWRAVSPMLLGCELGSVARIAGVVQAECPAHVVTEFRTRDVRDLERGRVRVSIEVGIQES